MSSSSSPVRRVLRAAAIATAAIALTALPTDPAAAAAAFTEPASDFVGTGQVVLRGTKDAGSALELSRVGAGVVCTIDASTATTWQCPSIPVPNGEQTFTGVETLADDSVEPLDPLVLRVLRPPTLNGSGEQVTTTGRFTGQAEPGASIQVQSDAGGAPQQHSCPDAVGSGFWSCVVALPEGEHDVRVRQSLPSLGPEYSNYSASTTATIDRTPPPAPLITSPRNGDAVRGPAVTVSGTGESDARVQVFTNGDIACEADVEQTGAWTCTLDLPAPGDWTLQALQRDAAGNFSSASQRVDITASAHETDQGGSTPGEPASPPGAGPGSTPSPQPDSSPSPEPDSIPRNPLPNAPPPPAGSGDGEPRLTSNWGTATGFGNSLPSAEQIIDRGGWALAPIVALAYVLLIALPLRAYATVVGPRLGTSPWRLTGRNRQDDHAEDEHAVEDSERPLLSPLLVVVATFAGAALIAALSGGIAADVRYLRLMAAIGLGLVLLNLLAVVIPARIAGRALRTPARARLLPGILIAALVAALLSRYLDLQPPLLLGVLLACLAVEPARLRARGGVAIAQIAGVATLAVLAWAVHTLLMPSVGFWATFTAETTAAIAMGGFGSLLLLLLPIGRLPGRELYAISRGGWAVVALTSASVTGAIVASGASFPLLALGLIALGIAAVVSALAVWVRWVAPSLDG
ncbi:MAG: Ig-like domain-containing protein [Microcella sp.]|uniref:Ig-like domain-containing protein n=1 Tax=Microcella sp. TaxID=1913979 RepID=UPI003314FA71